jgi:hypothetical protein
MPGYATNVWQGGSLESWAVDGLRICVSDSVAAQYGSGCGQPAMAAAPLKLPLPGVTHITEVTNVSSGIASMALVLSATQAFGLPLPLGSVGMPGCELLLDPAMLAQPCASSGLGVRHSLPIPNRPQLAGLDVEFDRISGRNAASGSTGDGGAHDRPS